LLLEFPIPIFINANPNHFYWFNPQAFSIFSWYPWDPEVATRRVIRHRGKWPGLCFQAPGGSVENRDLVVEKMLNP
jgi:hypothetical protein